MAAKKGRHEPPFGGIYLAQSRLYRRGHVPTGPLSEQEDYEILSFLDEERPSVDQDFVHRVRRIETAMQRMELSALNTLPANLRSLVRDGQPVVLEIKVKAGRGQGVAGNSVRLEL